MSALAVLIQERVQRTPDGRFWVSSSSDYRYYSKFRDIFSTVRILARTCQVREPSGLASRLDGEGVGVIPLADTRGLGRILLSQRLYRRQFALGFEDSQAVVLRVPFFLSDLATITLARMKIPFGADVIGDGWDALSPGSGIGGALRPVIRRIFTFTQKRTCRRATCAKYVTRRVLQARYPCPGPQFASSDVMLGPDAYSAEIKPFPKARPLRLISVGTLETLYKAPDVQIECIRLLRDIGLDVRLTFVGDGKRRGELNSLATKMGVDDAVEFRGRLPAGQAIRDELDKAHIFIMPSLAEGLPRSLLEAMARGMPCVGTSVGGIVELLPETDLVPPRNAKALADRIAEIAKDEARWVWSAGHNLAVSRDYEETRVRATLREFLTCLRERAG